MRRVLVSVSILLLSFTLSASADAKLEPTGAFADPAASESIRNAMEEKGHRVTLGDGTVWCEFWLRKAFPAQPKKDVAGAVYTEIPESAVIGVISFPKPATDYRGQGIKAGAYTLRYSLHPTDGNHLGISSVRDFLVLVPVADDRDIDAHIKYDDLMKLSAKSSGTTHPAPLSLVYPEDKSGLTQDDHGHITFFGKMKTASGGAMPISFVVKGVAEQ